MLPFSPSCCSDLDRIVQPTWITPPHHCQQHMANPVHPVFKPTWVACHGSFYALMCTLLHDLCSPVKGLSWPCGVRSFSCWKGRTVLGTPPAWRASGCGGAPPLPPSAGTPSHIALLITPGPHSSTLSKRNRKDRYSCKPGEGGEGGGVHICYVSPTISTHHSRLGASHIEWPHIRPLVPSPLRTIAKWMCTSLHSMY